jgi:hypothetical protein
MPGLVFGALTPMVMVPPSGVCLKAFDRRLKTILSKLPWSIQRFPRRRFQRQVDVAGYGHVVEGLHDVPDEKSWEARHDRG